MNQEELQRWEGTRTRGMCRYILANGVLRFGLPFALVALVMRRPQLSYLITLVSMLLALAAGAAYGTVMWFIQERQYQKVRSSTDA